METNSISENKKIRNSNFELLRIVCMFLIIAHHYSWYGGWGDATINNLSVNRVFIQILLMTGKCACNVFVMITGYFMIKSQFNYKKLIKLIAEMIFYSLGIYILFIALGKTEFDILTFIHCLFPMIWGGWFIVTYVFLYVLIPFINPMILKSDKSLLQRLIIVLFILYSVIGTLTNSKTPFSSIDNFIFMYIMGAYIRLYPIEIFNNKKRNICFMVISFSVLILSVLFFDVIGILLNKDFIIKSATYLQSQDSVIAILCAITIFIVFKDINIQSNIINWFASSTLAVYLIHDNDFIREVIWQNISSNSKYLESEFLFIHAIIKIIAIFVICVLIDKARLYILEIPIIKLINKMKKQTL